MKIAEIGALLRSRQMSCVELAQQTLSAIQERDRFNAFITVTADVALNEAKERDRELANEMDRGPLHGIPIAYKDLFCIAGVRTTAGSLIYRDFVPEDDAAAATAFREAGAVCVGKTNLHELAFGITSGNPHFGAVLNPLDTTRIPGGSSGGSAAAIAAELVPVSLGTDTGGSVRIPASYCGLVGLKPTYGTVSRDGVIPLAWTLDHVGPLASSVEDCAAALKPISSVDSREVPRPLKALRFGVPQNFFFEHVDAEVEHAVRTAIERIQEAGARVTDVRIPDLHQANSFARIVQLVEVAALYGEETHEERFGRDVWALIQQGRMIPGYEYVNAQRLRTLFRHDFDALWNTVDVLVTPTTPITAPALDQERILIGNEVEDVRLATTRLVRPINFLGEPAISLPCGKASNGMPIGLQLIARPFGDWELVAAAREIEQLLA